jgi:hypothetical protein
MFYSHTTVSIDTTETVRINRGDQSNANHVTVHIEAAGGDSVSFVLSFRNGHDENAAWLRNLASELNLLADRCEVMGFDERVVLARECAE